MRRVHRGAESSMSSRLPRLGTAADLDAAAGEVHPRVVVRRVLLGGDDDVVAGLPGEALGDDADAVRGVRDEGDVVRVGVDEPGGAAADLRDAVEPGLVRRRCRSRRGRRRTRCRAATAGAESGATAAWSRNAQRAVTGKSGAECRKVHAFVNSRDVAIVAVRVGSYNPKLVHLIRGACPCSRNRPARRTI